MSFSDFGYVEDDLVHGLPIYSDGFVPSKEVDLEEVENEDEIKVVDEIPSFSDLIQIWKIEETQIPIITKLTLPEAMKSLSRLLGCMDFQFDLWSFWYLDMVTECLKYLQDELKASTYVQAAMLSIMQYIVKYIEEENTTRDNMIERLRAIETKTVTSLGEKQEAKVEDLEGSSELSIEDIMAINEQVYKVFANGFHYKLISYALMDPPPLTVYKLPHNFNMPKKHKPIQVSSLAKPAVQDTSTAKGKVKKDTKGGNKKGVKRVSVEEEPVPVFPTAVEEVPKEQEDPNKFLPPLLEAVDIQFFDKVFNRITVSASQGEGGKGKSGGDKSAKKGQKGKGKGK